MTMYKTMFGEEINMDDLSMKEMRILSSYWEDPEELQKHDLGKEFKDIVTDRNLIVNGVRDYRVFLVSKVESHFPVESDFLRVTGINPASWSRIKKLDGHMNMEGLLNVLAALKLKLSFVGIDSNDSVDVGRPNNAEFFTRLMNVTVKI